jgi:hypothetical protein
MRLAGICLAVALLAVGCGCLRPTAVTLRNGEVVETLYYHESRMPEEMMAEL